LLRRFWLRRERRHLLALLADHGDRAANRYLTLADGDLQEHPGGLGLDLLRHLVGVELVERLAFLDGVALALQPLDDRAGLHPLAEPRELDLVSHGPLSGGSPRAHRRRAARRAPPSRARTGAARTSHPRAPPARRASRRPSPARRPRSRPR